MQEIKEFTQFCEKKRKLKEKQERLLTRGFIYVKIGL